MPIIRVIVYVISDYLANHKKVTIIRNEIHNIFWCGGFSHPVVGFKGLEYRREPRYFRMVEIKLLEVDNTQKKVILFEGYTPGIKCIGKKEIICIDFSYLEMLCGGKKKADEIEKKFTKIEEPIIGGSNATAKITGKRVYRKVRDVSFKDSGDGAI